MSSTGKVHVRIYVEDDAGRRPIEYELTSSTTCDPTEEPLPAAYIATEQLRHAVEVVNTQGRARARAVPTQPSEDE